MVGLSRIRRTGLMAAAGLAALMLASCSDYVGKIPKHLAPLDPSTRALVEKKGMDQKAPILIRLFKEESKLEVWKQQRATGRYALLKEYEICAWSGVLGPKLKEGDRQAPEGFYNIRPAQMNPNSSYHLSFNIGFPNEFDRSYGRTGSDLMVHGACSSRGCYSMTDEQIQEIYTLGRLAFEGGQRDFQVQAFPFRMTPDNMAKHRDNANMPFWRMLKEGYDHFELIRQPPKVDVCDRRYVFNAMPGEGGAFKATSACPPLLMPEEIRVAVAKKEADDDRQMMEIAGRLDRKEGSGTATILAAALATPTTASLAGPMSVATAPVSLEPATVSSIGTASAAPLPDAEPAAPPAAVAAAEPTTVDTASAPAGSAPPASAEPEKPAAVAVADPAPVAEAPKAAPVSDGEATKQAPAPTLASAPAAEKDPANAPASEPAAAATAPAPAAPQPSATAEASTAPKPAQSDEVSLEERMLAGSEAPDAAAPSAYAPEPDEGLTGFVLRMFE